MRAWVLACVAALGFMALMVTGVGLVWGRSVPARVF
ncbi:hypothetical protein Ae168Ps1_6141c [Pseudonocardia sp. Ae168_Ps1]|nr:hypothetical protein Ae150APs1_6075c [Pseudonocardia sp. Ae150A_Ps1]OLL70676.1 hypothetical protein Ae168Ps1_6141c [Pseudonocardia sp. Ae168_Ps1]